MKYQLMIGDSFQHLVEMDSESIDLIVTDPPYESLEKHRNVGTTTRLKNTWFDVITNEKLKQYVYEMHRVLQEDSHAYVICDQETHYVVKAAAEECGFTWKKFLVWNKQSIGMGYSWRCQHELICYLEKGKRKLNNLGWPDVLSHKRVANGYPTEKPVSLFSQLIENSTDEGDIIYDPFCGSGACIEAGLSLNRNVLASEVKPEQEQLINQRLANSLGIETQKSALFVPRKQLAISGF